MNITNKTLNELEGIPFPAPPKDASNLVQKIYLLRNKSFSELDAEDLRILISQKQALAFVLPKALDILKSNPFISGDSVLAESPARDSAEGLIDTSTMTQKGKVTFANEYNTKLKGDQLRSPYFF